MSKKKARIFTGFDWSDKPPRSLSKGGFLRHQEFIVRHCFADNSYGPYYSFETISPPCLDAVVLLIYVAGPPARILLRHGLRPAAAVRARLPLPEGSDKGFPPVFWELPAGGVEASDWSLGTTAALQHRAQEEGWEETGLKLLARDFFVLGPSPFPTASFSAERLHFMAIPLPHARETTTLPPGDGHPMEQGAWVKWVELECALEWCRNGTIIDSKTELGLRRLHEYLQNT